MNKEFQDFIVQIITFLKENEVILENIISYEEQQKEEILKHANNGWFYDMNFTTFESKKLDDKFFMEHFENNIEYICKSLVDNYPKRAKIIEKAIKSHKIGDYELSIPVLLSQIDGIYKEETQTEYFQKLEKKKTTIEENVIKEIKNSHNDIMNILIIPFCSNLTISYSEKDRNKSGLNSFDLNRHAILHGESTDYGTKINSLKTISFLNFTAQFFAELKYQKYTSSKS